MNWRNGKIHNPRDPPFVPPISTAGAEQYEELEEEDDESMYGRTPLRDNSNNSNSPFSDNAAPSNRQSQTTSYVLPPVGGVGGFGAPPSVSNMSSGAGSIPTSRPSMDAYGAFSDPAPSGFGGGTPALQPPSFAAASGLADVASPAGSSRTMQYADPYAAVRASIASGSAPGTMPTYSGATSPIHPPGPPSYTEYTGYR